MGPPPAIQAATFMQTGPTSFLYLRLNVIELGTMRVALLTRPPHIVLVQHLGMSADEVEGIAAFDRLLESFRFE